MTPATQASVTITKDELIRCLRALTIDRDSFDGGQWSIDDADTLEMIAASVREAIEESRCRLIKPRENNGPTCVSWKQLGYDF